MAPEQALRNEIKELLVSTLRMEGVSPSDVADTEPLFAPDNRLGLDSLSALEMLSAIEYKYKVRFENDGSAKRHFASVAALAAFVSTAGR
jgi:acyl carrier protein